MAQMPDRSQIPATAELLNPTLAAIRALGGSATIAEIENRIAADLGLPEAVTQVPHGRGSATELAYRLGWARTHLKNYGMLDNSARGIWSFTPLGETTATVDPGEVMRFVQDKYRQRTDDGTPEPGPQLKDFPDDAGDSWREVLMGSLRNMPPDAFERLCQRLLRESGFEEVEVTGRPGDGGIDGRGLIRLSGLISFSVVFQCKRYSGSVGPGEVQAFQGAVQGQADRGMFLTTGTFTRSARQAATRPGAVPIDLIDGELLLDKLKELRLGIKVTPRTVEDVEVETAWFNAL